ncbi:MAG: flagellar biosynthesis protein FlgN [Spirochaetaceae bacterium]|nr:flagellar biosynthesis protein FlgN [Spirochaetaceae bacterium]
MDLTNEEIQERTAILKRLRNLLEQQRSKFREYLKVLEAQEKTIQTENTESLLAHTELEQQIAANIINLQKVIKPIEKMYEDSYNENDVLAKDIPLLKADLENLQQQVLERNKKNRDLLQVQLVQLKERISSIKNPYKNNRSIYTQTSNIATQINFSV